jgi:hypothetical protein
METNRKILLGETRFKRNGSPLSNPSNSSQSLDNKDAKH